MRTILAAALALALLAGCSDTPADNPEGDQNATVEMRDFNFNPSTVNVRTGSAVAWNNVGNTAHTVTADDGSFDSGNVPAGDDYTRTFDREGNFPYHCKLHPQMTGTIKVEAKAATT